jgi:DNA-binding MarR family transcriptional regulator
VALTPAGEKRLAQAKGAVAEAEQSLLAPLDEREREQLHGLLKRMAGHCCSPGGGQGRC